MNAIVVYESIYGNTHAIADAVADTHGLATTRSRQMAAAAAHEDGETASAQLGQSLAAAERPSEVGS